MNLPNYDNWLIFGNNPYEEDTEEQYYCKYCGCLVTADEKDEEVYCSHCATIVEAKPESYWRL